MRALVILFGVTACVMAFTDESIHIENADGTKFLIPPDRGPSDTKWTLTTCLNCKMVITCQLIDKNCNSVNIEIWNGEKMYNHCDIENPVSSYASINSRMTVKISTTGSELPAYCQIVATKPYINMPEKTFDSTEHAITLEDNDCRCGWANRKGGSRIVGGRSSLVNEFPFIVLILNRIDDDLFPFCGGTIISIRHILTAAHCTHNKHNSSLHVLLGDHDVSNNKETPYAVMIDVKQTIEHEKYDDKKSINDISLIVLEQSIVFNDYVGPICMPKAIKSLVNQHVKVMGWGLTKFKGNFSTKLRYANLKVIDPEVCKTIYSTKFEEYIEFCTYSDNKDACQGDSGGPLVWLNQRKRFTQVGIVSYGVGCATTNPAVNTDITKYMDWIKSKIQATYPQRMCY